MNRHKIANILAENGIGFNPSDCFEHILSEDKQIYEGKTYRELFDILHKYKKAEYKLNKAEEKERSLIVSVLFERIASEKWEEPLFDNKVPRPNKLHQPLTLELFKALPSRYQRAGRQLILTTGHFQDFSYENLINCMNMQGEELELKALQLLTFHISDEEKIAA